MVLYYGPFTSNLLTLHDLVNSQQQCGVMHKCKVKVTKCKLCGPSIPISTLLMTLKIGYGVRQGHWKFHHVIECKRLPIYVL